MENMCCTVFDTLESAAVAQSLCLSNREAGNWITTDRMTFPTYTDGLQANVREDFYTSPSMGFNARQDICRVDVFQNQN